MSSTWSNTRTNFARAWDFAGTSTFNISEGAGPDDLLISPALARGLVDGETYDGTLIASDGLVHIVFRLKASGLSQGRKTLSFESALEGSVPVTVTGPESTDSDWGGHVDDFDGHWKLAGGHGSMEIHHGGQVQLIDVDGVKNLVYGAELDEGAKELSITFRILNNGFVNDDPNNLKEVLFLYPEVYHIPLDGVPTEGERFEEAASGGPLK